MLKTFLLLDVFLLKNFKNLKSEKEELTNRQEFAADMV